MLRWRSYRTRRHAIHTARRRNAGSGDVESRDHRCWMNANPMGVFRINIKSPLQPKCLSFAMIDAAVITKFRYK